MRCRRTATAPGATPAASSAASLGTTPGATPAASPPTRSATAPRATPPTRFATAPGAAPAARFATTFALALALGLALALSGCASSSSPPPDRDRITPREIEETRATNALELVERLRPSWLMASRGERSINLETTILVYQNRTMLGGVDQLRFIPIDVVRSMRALDAVEAGQLAGLGSQHVERAILVLTHDDG